MIKRIPIILLISGLLLALAACSRAEQQFTVPAETGQQAAALATQAASAAATVAAGPAAEMAATVAAQGSNVVATAQASGVLTEGDINALRERLGAIQPDAAGNVTATVTDAEVNQVLRAAEAQAIQAGVPPRIQNAQVAFTGGNIVMSGNVTDPVVAQLAVTFQPAVENGELRFAIISATVGNINVPPTLLSAAEATLNNHLGAAFNALPQNVVLHTIVMSEGTMTVTGSQS